MEKKNTKGQFLIQIQNFLKKRKNFKKKKKKKKPVQLLQR